MTRPTRGDCISSATDDWSPIVKDCPTPAPKPHRAWTAQRTTAAVGQPLTEAVIRQCLLSGLQQSNNPNGSRFSPGMSLVSLELLTVMSSSPRQSVNGIF